MCGIAGIVNIRGNAVEPPEMSRLTDLLAHRGPDGAGNWFSAERNVALGHRRLAIIDPGAGGYQPMLSADGRYVIIFNGEIYNFLELRRELEAQRRGLPHPVGHRGHPCGVASLAGRDVVALQRHVGAGDFRHPDQGTCFSRATVSASSRCSMRCRRSVLFSPRSSARWCKAA